MTCRWRSLARIRRFLGDVFTPAVTATRREGVPGGIGLVHASAVYAAWVEPDLPVGPFLGCRETATATCFDFVCPCSHCCWRLRCLQPPPPPRARLSICISSTLTLPSSRATRTCRGKPTTVRLDTYSSAPVQFAVYQVDPADVLTAGSNARPRAIDTRGRRPVATLQLSRRPGGYQFQSSEVDVQLGSREGFFVVEARRGDVGEQVWINRTRVGLLTKETPGELLLYATDLGTGHALARMRVQFVVENAFRDALHRCARHRALESLAATRLCARAMGRQLRFRELSAAGAACRRHDRRRAHRHRGRARRRHGAHRRLCADAQRTARCDPPREARRLSLRSGGTLLAQVQAPRRSRPAHLRADIPIPASAAAGDYAVLAQVDGGVGGATVHVDADASGLSLDVASGCDGPCDPSADVPVVITSSRGDVPVRVTVVRSPHVYVGYTPQDVPWGTTPVAR